MGLHPKPLFFCPRDLMNMIGTWLLPEHLADVLPAEARQIEELRRRLLDLYRTHGFEMVAPPLVEFIESLLTGAGEDLSLRTFKLTDQLSGRTLGIRADTTSQITRIDAHLLNRPGVARLCYCGPVLHARPAGLLASREQLQIGAEIYGHADSHADVEIVRLAARSLTTAGVRDFQIVLSHDGLVSAIMASDPAAQAQASEIMALLRDKDMAGLSDLRRGPQALRADTVDALEALPRLYGGGDVVSRARAQLAAFPGVASALLTLEALLGKLNDLNVSVDLADIGAYGYHTGVTFSFYAQGWHDALVRGGRYDNVGRAFGRPRAATGFSMDLRRLARALGPAERALAILAPAGDEPALLHRIAALREDGEIVVQLFPGESACHDEFAFDRNLVWDNDQWVVRAVGTI